MSTIFFKKSGSGHPLVLIHGFCENHEIWTEFAEALSEKFEVYLIDLPGFGNSPLPSEPFSIDSIGAEVSEWIDLKRIEQPIIIGHSLGGYVTLAMAARHPEKFAGIGLFHSTAYPDSEERKTNRNKVIEFVKAHGVDPFIDTFVPSLFFNKKHLAIPAVDKIARSTSQQTLLAYTAAMRDRPSSIDFLKKVSKPLLILGGDKDSVIPAEITKELGQLNRKSIVHLFKNTGHMAMYECPQEAQKVITEFVETIPGAIPKI